MHGDDPSRQELHTLTGQPTVDVSAVVDDIEQVLRRALVRLLSGVVEQ
ncbi:hypothetical protein [Micromonospora aurantiaca (nom. illeg.)]